MNDFLAKVLACREEEMRLARAEKAKDKRAEHQAQKASEVKPALTVEQERQAAIKSLRARGYAWVLDDSK